MIVDEEAAGGRYQVRENGIRGSDALQDSYASGVDPQEIYRKAHHASGSVNSGIGGKVGAANNAAKNAKSLRPFVSNRLSSQMLPKVSAIGGNGDITGDKDHSAAAIYQQ